MRRLLVVAASGLAREALAVVRELSRFDDIRVLDDDPGTWGTSVGEAPVVGGIELVTEYGDHELLVCIGGGRSRRAVVERLSDLGVEQERYTTLVHPRVLVSEGCRVGRGSILLEGVVLTSDVQVGSHVVVMPHVTLTHDVVVEDYATLCAGVSLGGGVRVGSGAYVGMNACVRERVTVGGNATLGMGSVLVGDLPPGETWAGVPARALHQVHGTREVPS